MMMAIMMRAMMRKATEYQGKMPVSSGMWRKIVKKV